MAIADIVSDVTFFIKYLDLNDLFAFFALVIMNDYL